MAKAQKPGQTPTKSSKPKSSSQPPPPPTVDTSSSESYSSESAMMYGGSGPARTSHREIIQLPVGFELPDGKLVKEAEVRACYRWRRNVYRSICAVQSKSK